MFPRWVTVAYLAYLVAPILLLLVGSFGGLWLNTLLPTGFTGRWYLEVAADPSFRRAFNASLFVAAATGAACLAIGLPLAYAVFRAQNPAVRAAARALYLLPIALPALVLAFGFILVFSSDTLPWLGSIWLLVEPETYAVRPDRFRGHLFDALWFVWALGLLEILEALHKYRLLPTLLTWY